MTDEVEVIVDDSNAVDVTLDSQGAPGRDGVGAPIQKLAAVSLGGHRLVVLNDSGNAIYADHTLLNHMSKVLGLTLGAATADQLATIATYGEVEEPSWTWTPGTPLFLGTNGLLTATAPTSGFSIVVGFAMTATTIFINIGQPIILL